MPKDWLGRHLLPPGKGGYRAVVGRRTPKTQPPQPPRPSKGAPTSAREIGSKDAPVMGDCKFVASDQPRVIKGRHSVPCTCDGELGCLPCPETHCVVCGRAHAKAACTGCLDATRRRDERTMHGRVVRPPRWRRLHMPGVC